MHRLRTEEPDIAGVPSWLAPPLRRALVKHPAARATAAEILAALGGPAPTVLLGATPRPTVAAAGVPPAIQPAPREPATRAGSRWLGPVVLLAAVVAAGAGWLFVNRPSAHAGSPQAASGATPTPAATSTPGPVTTPSATPAATSSTSSTPPTPSSSTSTEATTPATSTDTSGQASAWGDADVVLRAVRSQDQERPAFPAEVPGYSLADQNNETVRIFSDKRWQLLYEFPATMNGCDQQRFYVRWRSLDPSAEVDATWVSSDGSMIENKVVRGSAGWQAGYGCSQPAFRLHSSRSRSTLDDVVVDVQLWTASS